MHRQTRAEPQLDSIADNRPDDLRALFARYITSLARVSDPRIV